MQTTEEAVARKLVSRKASPRTPPSLTTPLLSFTFENTKKDRHKLCHTIANAKTKVLMET